MWSEASFASEEREAAPKVVLEQLKRMGWTPTAETEYWRYKYAIIKWRSYGKSDSFVIEEAVQQENSRLSTSGSFFWEFHFASISQAGWPLRCLSRKHFDPSGSGRPSYPLHPSIDLLLSGSSIDKRSLTPIANWQHSMSLPVPEKIGSIELPTDRHLPLRPIWSGFIINSFIYAAILGVMMFIASMANQHRRFKKGHCPKCNYELRSDYSTGCPECGWGREAEA